MSVDGKLSTSSTCCCLAGHPVSYASVWQFGRDLLLCSKVGREGGNGLCGFCVVYEKDELRYTFEASVRRLEQVREMNQGKIRYSCPGLTDPKLSCLYSLMSPGPLSRSISLERVGEMYPEFMLQYRKLVAEGSSSISKQLGVYGYEPDGRRLRSVLCTGVAGEDGSKACVSCLALATNAYARADVVRNRQNHNLERAHVDVKFLTVPEACKALSLVRKRRTKDRKRFAAANAIKVKTVERLVERISKMDEAMCRADEDELVKEVKKAVYSGKGLVSLPSFCLIFLIPRLSLPLTFNPPNVVNHALGVIGGHKALKQLLTESMKALSCRNKGRRLSNTTKRFYTVLLQQGGSMLHDWVSEFLCGPSLSTTHRFMRSGNLPDSLGLTDKHIDCAVTLLKQWGLLGAPCLLSEDGTALQVRLDAILRGNKDNKHIVLFGLNGGSVVITDVKQFKRVVMEKKVATILYAYTLVPLVRGAPHIPLFFWCHDSTRQTFDAARVLQVWKYLWQVSYNRVERIAYFDP